MRGSNKAMNIYLKMKYGYYFIKTYKKVSIF